jgi:holo-[acyl-carrier protein] synthase
MAKVVVGVDLVAVAEVQESLDTLGERYARRLFTADERRYCAAQRHAAAASYAARFAAKEATIKLLRPEADDPGLPWIEIEVVRAPGGGTDLALSGAALALARRRKLSGFSVSLSHEAGLAIAVVTATCTSHPHRTTRNATSRASKAANERRTSR